MFLGFSYVIACRPSSIIFIVTWYSKHERTVIYLSILLHTDSFSPFSFYLFCQYKYCIYEGVSLFPYGRVFPGYRPANTIGRFQVYLKEDSECPPVMLESPHYSLSLLNSDNRLQSNGFEMHLGCVSDCISRSTHELERFLHLSQKISKLSLCRDLGLLDNGEKARQTQGLTGSEFLRTPKAVAWVFQGEPVDLVQKWLSLFQCWFFDWSSSFSREYLGHRVRQTGFKSKMGYILHVTPCRPPNLLEPQEKENKVPHMVGG